MSRSVLSERHACVLGAVNGLLVGLAVESLRVIYEKYQMQHAMLDAARHGQNIGYMLEPVMSSFIPFVCVVAFAAASHLMYRYWMKYPQHLLLLWIVAGFSAVSIGYYVDPLGQDSKSFLWVAVFSFISYLTYRYWKNRPHSFLLLWPVIGISAVIVIAAGAQIVGLFMVQRYELRRPLTWLLCLTLALVVNVIYGTIAQSILLRRMPNKTRSYN